MKRMILSLLILALTVGCAAHPRTEAEETGKNVLWKKPPALTVQVGKEEASAVLGTYSWTWPNGDGTDTGVEADGPHPLDMPDCMTSLSPGGERKLTLRFALDGLTLDGLTVRRWDFSCVGDPDKYDSDFDMPPFTVKNDTVTVELPDDRGGIFEVHAYFIGVSRGDGYYAFCLRDETEGAEAFEPLPVRSVRQTGPAAPIKSLRNRTSPKSAPTKDGNRSVRGPLTTDFGDGNVLTARETTAVLKSPFGMKVIVHHTSTEPCPADLAAWLLLAERSTGVGGEIAPMTVKVP